MKILLAQMDILLGEKERNVKKARDIIQKSDSDIIVFPELFTTGFDYENLETLAEYRPFETVAKLQESCGKSLISGSILERDGKQFYNTMFLADGSKVLGYYRKFHIFDKEKESFSPGRDLSVINSPFGKIGMAICYDIRFPEYFRAMVKKDAHIFIIPSEFPKPRLNHWRVLLQARAIENQCFIIAVNRVGKDKRLEYFGHSLVIDPWGEIIYEAAEEEGTAPVEIDLSLVERIRKDFSVLDDIKEI